MPGEVDPRLIGLLQGVMGLADSLRDAGATGDVSVRLGRKDGLLLLKLVAGANDAEAEAWSQRGRSPTDGANSLKIAGLTFVWPQVDAARQRLEASRMFSAMPECVGAPANENSRSPATARFYGFEEDAPALR